MNTGMNTTIRRLTNLFIVLFLIVSGVAAYIQISNQAFYNGPVLANGSYAPLALKCPPYNAPLRGTIYDRNGNKIAWSVPDPNATCGYRREYASWVATSGLAPLIGYFSYTYGASGVEASYNNELAGTSVAQNRCQAGPTDVFKSAVQTAQAKLLHKKLYGCDVYLTIDKNLQIAAAQNYTQSAIYGGVCQQSGTNPAGSIIVEDPNTGEILAMVSEPSYDPNKIDDPAYWKQLNSDPQAPLLNHATQGLYTPGSTFKTLTLIAALDTGTYSLATQFDKAQATDFVANGEHIKWYDYFNGTWNGLVKFPLTLKDAYAYSDNTIYARAAVQVGANTWLSYLRKFGIATPGTNVQPVPFDAPSYQSQAYNTYTNGQPTQFTTNLLAESGFGQGQLSITPLTMAEVSSAVAANGVLYEPHVAQKVVPYGVDPKSVLPQPAVAFGGVPVMHPETAQAVRAAMWAVVDYGTGWAGLTQNGQYLKQSPVQEGGKTGTAQLHAGQPDAWWISLAPDDQGPQPLAAKWVATVMKERSGEGACQAFVADDTYKQAMSLNLP